MKINDVFRKEGDDGDDESSGSVYSISSKEHKYMQHVIQLGGTVISDPSEYFELIQFFYSVGDRDTVTLLLGGRGGSVDTGTQLAHAIKNCPCGVDVVVHSNCYSMHSILALCGKSLRMQPETFLMFHNYSGGQIGKGGELHLAIKEYDRHAKALDKHFCFPFLSSKELEMIANDQDVYVHESDKDFKRRAKRHFK